MEEWEVLELPDDLELEGDLFEFACCGGICGGGMVQ